MRLLVITTISFLLTTSAITQSNCEAQVPVYRNILLNDLGVSRLDRQGNPYITINPVRCRQLGPELCEFFRQHEYGHINLKHLERRVGTRRAEVEADCYAAKHVSPSIANAAFNWFSSGNGSSRVHGTSQQRANRVTACSAKEQPIVIPNRTLTRKLVTSPRKSYASNAFSNPSTRTVRNKPVSISPVRRVYVSTPKSAQKITSTAVQSCTSCR